MKLSASIELVWKLAGAEAAAGEFKEIGPEHFFLGLLKLADLPLQPTDKLGVHAATVRALLSEIGKLRELLKRRGIDPTRARRELRRTLGKGGCPFRGGVMHRAQSCRELFDAAVKSAGDAGHETLTSIHLLQMILDAPTPALAQVLDAIAPGTRMVKASPTREKAGAGVLPTVARSARSPGPSKAPRLDDLTAMAAEGRLSMPEGCGAECKALLQALSHKDRKSVLLLGDAHDLGRTVVVAAACSLTGRGPSPALKRRRLLEVRRFEDPGGDDEGLLNLWERLFAKVEAVNDVILLLPPLDESAFTQNEEWRDLLKRVLEKRAVQCICRASVHAYNQWVKKEKAFIRLAQVIWLHDIKLKSVPREL